MGYSSKLLEDAIDALSMLPSVGKKSAMRLALFLLNEAPEKGNHIGRTIQDLVQKVQYCKCCHTISDGDLCSICISEHRDETTICVVESIRDLIAIEETNQFKGKYHILGGIISPIEGVGPEDLNIATLVSRVKSDGIKELIMAISPTIEGETTMYYISKLLEGNEVNLSSIARGVAFGGELEYTDELTLGRSIQTRIPYTVSQ